VSSVEGLILFNRPHGETIATTSAGDDVLRLVRPLKYGTVAPEPFGKQKIDRVDSYYRTTFISSHSQYASIVNYGHYSFIGYKR
jgi:hypothetical protein